MHHACNEKRQMTPERQLSNQDKIRMLEKKEIYKNLAILEADAINQGEMKKKLRKNISGEPESYSRQNYIAETLSKE